MGRKERSDVIASAQVASKLLQIHLCQASHPQKCYKPPNSQQVCDTLLGVCWLNGRVLYATEELTEVTCCPDNFFCPVSLPEKEQVGKMWWPCGSLDGCPQWNDVIYGICRWLPNTFNVFHLCLQSFAIKSSPAALPWLCCFLFEEAYVRARVPLDGVETFQV